MEASCLLKLHGYDLFSGTVDISPKTALAPDQREAILEVVYPVVLGFDYYLSHLVEKSPLSGEVEFKTNKPIMQVQTRVKSARAYKVAKQIYRCSSLAIYARACIPAQKYSRLREFGFDDKVSAVVDISVAIGTSD